jgi:trans-2-enoyl-CoA reductase
LKIPLRTKETDMDLVEKVAREIALREGINGGDDWQEWSETARAALRIALEEAAMVADELGDFYEKHVKDENDMIFASSANAANDVAAAIRSLIPEEPTR